MDATQQAQFDEIKAGVQEVKELVQNSLNLQANGGYHVFNLMLPLEKKLGKLEESLNAPVTP
jgi:hypothetical protein